MSSLTTANTICFHSSTERVVVRAFHSLVGLQLLLLCPRPEGIKRLCCLTSVAYIRSAGGVCGRPAGWSVLANRARLGRPDLRLPLRASVAGLRGAYRGGHPPTACYYYYHYYYYKQCNGFSFGVHCADEGDRIPPLKGYGQALKQTVFSGVLGDDCGASANLLN